MIQPRLLLLAALVLPGCAALRKADAPVTMRIAPHFAPAPMPSAASVTVAPILASGMAAGRRYVYVTAGNSLVLNQAATFFWEVPPPQMLDAALADAFRAQFAGGPGSPSLGRLTTRLDRFEEVSSGSGANALVALDASFADPVHKLTMSGHYCKATAIAGSDGGTRAAAFQASVAALASALVQDVAAGRLSTATDC